MGRIRPGPLIARLQQVHVDTAAGALRSLRDRGEQCIAAPLHAIGSELHIEHRSGRSRRDLVDKRDEILRLRRRPRNQGLDPWRRACGGRAARIGSDGP